MKLYPYPSVTNNSPRDAFGIRVQRGGSSVLLEWTAFIISAARFFCPRKLRSARPLTELFTRTWGREYPTFCVKTHLVSHTEVFENPFNRLPTPRATEDRVVELENVIFTRYVTIIVGQNFF